MLQQSATFLSQRGISFVFFGSTMRRRRPAAALVVRCKFSCRTISSSNDDDDARPSDIICSSHDKMSPKTRQLADDLLDPTEQANPWKKRIALSKAITLTESTNASMRQQANLLLEHLVNQKPPSSSSFRLGFAGAPGEPCNCSFVVLLKIACILNYHD